MSVGGDFSLFRKFFFIKNKKNKSKGISKICRKREKNLIYTEVYIFGVRYE